MFRACPGVLGADGRAEEGVITSQGDTNAFAQRFLGAVARHRFWTRGRKNRMGTTPDDDTRGRAVMMTPGRPGEGKMPRP